MSTSESTPISYLLIGGYAASHAAKAIRQRDTQGRVVLLTAEASLPYERPPLSKQMLFEDNFTPDAILAHQQTFYEEQNIEVRTGARVTQINRATQTVKLENGEVLGYEKLLLALGAGAKKPEAVGFDFPNVYFLRKVGDSQKIRAAINAAIDRGGRAVVVGGSYLGLEAASGCLKKGLDVTIVDSHDGPWSKFASPQLKKFLVGEYEARGAKFVFNQRIQEISGKGRAQSVKTEEGELPCDFVIAATGSTLNTQLAKECGLKVDDKFGIVVDEHYRTDDENIWAAGDCIHYPDPVVSKMWHNEHYTNAHWSGELAGANMSGEAQKLERAPYFFSDFLDFHMVLRGNPAGGKSARVIGSMVDGEFVELYGDESGILKMGVGITRNKVKSEKIAATLERLILAGTRVENVLTNDLGF